MREISVVLGSCICTGPLGFTSCFEYSESLKELERLPGYSRMPALCHIHIWAKTAFANWRVSGPVPSTGANQQLWLAVTFVFN